MDTIFISHSTKDREYLESRLLPLLQAFDVRLWYAPTDVNTADEWERTILAGLRQCDWFMVVLSVHSVSSEWVKSEVHWALENRKGRIVPIRIDDCDSIELHLHLPRIQHLNFYLDPHSAQSRLGRIWPKKQRSGREEAQVEHTPDAITPMEALRSLIASRSDRIKRLKPVYYNEYQNGWVKRKMRMSDVVFKEQTKKPDAVLVSFDANLRQTPVFRTRSEAEASEAFSKESASKCRVLYALHYGTWVAERREYAWDDGSWHLIPRDAPDSWPTVLLLEL